jgi:membrane associated rhomboid family serine protease
MANLSRRAPSAVARAFSTRITVLWRLTLTLWVLELVDTLLLASWLDRFGIRPRTVDGLWGVATAPFLHAGLGHLLANTLTLWPLGFLAMARHIGDFYRVFFTSLLVGGLGTWLLGRGGSVHVGASGVIFGFLGFLLARGYYERRPGAILMSLFTLFVYGGLVWQALPFFVAAEVSWEGHLFGMLGGVLAAKRTSGRG